MRENHWATKILNIRTEELKPVLLLMVFSFFIGLSLTFYFAASNAIFLKHFPSKMIPVSFIASGVVVYCAWWIFSQIDRKLSLYSQVTVKFLFVFISVLAISTGVWAYDTTWLAFLMYTWVRVMVYITLVNFWGMAGRLFNIRQGKRIFGLISIGEVISIIIGYFSIPLILRFLKAPDLLFLASFSLFICLVLVFIIFRTFKDQLHAGITSPKPVQTTEKSEWNYWNLLKKPYFLMISLMALLPIFGYLFVDFLFLAQTKKEFANNPETIASFLGIFLGSVAILELVLKLLSGRFLNKFGLKLSLLSLPVVLLFSIVLAAVFGTMYGAVGMFFAFIVLARLFERSVRGSLYEPAFQLLYQPVPTDQRLPFQNQIEGIPKALGTVITGVVILLFSTIPAFNLVHFNWLFILVLALWIWIAFKMYEEYRNMLKTKLTELKNPEQNKEHPMVALIRQTFAGAQPGQFRLFVDLFDKTEPASLKAFLESTPEISAILKKEGISGKSDEEEAEGFTFEHMVEMARSDDVSERLRVARLLGTSARYITYKLLISLMKDPDPDVKTAAIISSGKIRRVELWPAIIENLGIPEFSHPAEIAVKIIGTPVLKELDRFFEKSNANRQVQLKIIRIYESVGGETAARYLRDKIYHPDHDIRFQVLLSLSNLEYRASVAEIPFIKQTIEETVEILAWILASLADIRGVMETRRLQEALLQEMEEKKEHVFLLLSLLYDSKTIGHIRSHIESKDTNAKIYALEISDMIISEEIKELFIPIFEDLSVQDRLNRFATRFPQEKLPLFQRIEDIINKDYSKVNRWTKACAIDILDKVQADDRALTSELLAANMVNPDPLLAELAAWLLYKTDRPYFKETMTLFDNKNNKRLSEIILKIKSIENSSDLLIFEKVLMLKNVDFFTPVNEIRLINLITGLREPGDTSSLPSRQTSDHLIISSEGGYTLYLPLEGIFELMAGDPVMTERYIHLYYKNNPA